MTELSPSNVAYVAKQAGFKGQGLVIAVAVALAENDTLDPAAKSRNPDGNQNVGIWQIDTVNAPGQDLTNPFVNAQVAYKVSKGGTDWSAWETYANGAYKGNLGVGQAAANAPTDKMDNTPLWKQWLQGASLGAGNLSGSGGPSIPNPLAGIDKVAAVIEAFYKAITDGKMWRSLGWVLVGVAILIFGLTTWIGKTDTFRRVAGAATMGAL